LHLGLYIWISWGYAEDGKCRDICVGGAHIKLLMLSDLHLEFEPLCIADTGADVVILADDDTPITDGYCLLIKCPVHSTRTVARFGFIGLPVIVNTH
jgi:hypothetical protein